MTQLHKLPIRKPKILKDTGLLSSGGTQTCTAAPLPLLPTAPPCPPNALPHKLRMHSGATAAFLSMRGRAPGARGALPHAAAWSSAADLNATAFRPGPPARRSPRREPIALAWGEADRLRAPLRGPRAPPKLFCLIHFLQVPSRFP